jgi:hypothetical protein
MHVAAANLIHAYSTPQLSHKAGLHTTGVYACTHLQGIKLDALKPPWQQTVSTTVVETLAV